MTKISRLAILLLLLSVSVSLRLTSEAQIRPIYDQGALGFARQLKGLNTTASALMIGAHPDDEDTALLTYLARGENARTAYLSLTRGDGGQNILGPELGEALGVIRTEELLQARKLDGAEQFFTRAYDYGFSKTLNEAKSKWDEKMILCDVVRVIRGYQPLVVIAQFSGTPADGHGQHQFAGYITPLAVKAAADASQCTDTGPAWTVKKFYVRQRGQGEPTLRINTGRYDPLLGRSYFEIAMHARSQHRSQEQGVLELKGNQFSSLKIVSGPNPLPEKESGIFEGLDTSVPGASASFDPNIAIPERLMPKLVELLPRSSAAVLRASGVQLDVLTDRETAVPGETVRVSVRVFAPRDDVKVTNIVFNFPHVKVPEPTLTGGQGPFRREDAKVAEFFQLTIPADAPPTTPYWLSRSRQGAMFAISPGSSAAEALQLAPAYAIVTFEIDGKKFRIQNPVEYRFADDIRGEIRRELAIVPKLAVALDQELVVISTRGKSRGREMTVKLANNVDGKLNGKVRLNIPSGWKVEPAETDFAMARKGERSAIKFSLTIPAQVAPGSYQITAQATASGDTFSQSMQTIAYEHIQTHRIYRPAKSDVKVIDLATAPLRVGYIRGSGDAVPEALRQLGLEVRDIDEKTLATGDLSIFDTIVVGIRAYQVRPDIVANNQRLLDFANNGGTLVVQYQLPPSYTQQVLTPFPAQAGPRTADENAPVTITQPTHPLLNFPNKITQDDFKDWVQERNLYNFSTMDPKYVGLLETHDTGESENTGGLVVADIGKGKYVYCSYSLFRQLPAGVPGAYRLLANLVSFSGTAKRG